MTKPEPLKYKGANLLVSDTEVVCVKCGKTAWGFRPTDQNSWACSGCASEALGRIEDKTSFKSVVLEPTALQDFKLLKVDKTQLLHTFAIIGAFLGVEEAENLVIALHTGRLEEFISGKGCICGQCPEEEPVKDEELPQC